MALRGRRRSEASSGWVVVVKADIALTPPRGSPRGKKPGRRQLVDDGQQTSLPCFDGMGANKLFGEAAPWNSK